jgi:uncharacterized protein YjiS (DUF1127 family)
VKEIEKPTSEMPDQVWRREAHWRLDHRPRCALEWL